MQILILLTPSATANVRCSVRTLAEGHCCRRARSRVRGKSLPRETADIALAYLYHVVRKKIHLASTFTSLEEKPDTKEACEVWDESNSLTALKNRLFLPRGAGARRGHQPGNGPVYRALSQAAAWLHPHS